MNYLFKTTRVQTCWTCKNSLIKNSWPTRSDSVHGYICEHLSQQAVKWNSFWQSWTQHWTQHPVLWKNTIINECALNTLITDSRCYMKQFNIWSTWKLAFYCLIWNVTHVLTCILTYLNSNNDCAPHCVITLLVYGIFVPVTPCFISLKKTKKMYAIHLFMCMTWTVLLKINSGKH